MHPVDDRRGRATEARRLTLEIRTLTVTLRTALADLDRDPTLSTADRIATQREWCDRVAILLQDIRARSLRIARFTASASDVSVPLDLLDRADDDLERLRGPAA